MSLCVLSVISHANAISYNYVTSIKVNQIELNAPVSADQINKLVKQRVLKPIKSIQNAQEIMSTA